MLNNQGLNSIFGINHTLFANATNSGKHTLVEMIDNGTGRASNSNASGEGIISCFTPSGQEIALGYAPGNTLFSYQLTRTITAQADSFGLNPNNYYNSGVNFTGGWTFLPGGLIFQYGKVTAISNLADVTVPYPVPMAQIFFASMVPVINTGVNITLVVLSANTSNMIVRSNSLNPVSFYWSVIGI